MTDDAAAFVFVVICVLAIVGVVAIVGVTAGVVLQRLETRRREKVHELSQDEIEDHLRPWAPSVRNGKVKLP